MFRSMLRKARRAWKDERGIYGGVELMFIIAGVAILASTIMAPFKGNGTTTGLPGSANNVAGMVQDTINSAANN